jgi:hypothetical protein
MKRFFLTFLIAIIAVTTFAAKDYYSARVYFNSGSVKRGLATFVENGPNDFILFKENEESEAEKIGSNSIVKIIYTFDKKDYEYAFLKVYKGWKQAEITGPIWLEVVKKGPATLYLTSTVLSSPREISVSTGLVTGGGSATFHDYYIMRKGEPAAKLIATISSLNNNQTFKAKAPLYFSDYPELAKKIEDKTYTWKNLEEVVDIYNEWAAKH